MTKLLTLPLLLLLVISCTTAPPPDAARTVALASAPDTIAQRNRQETTVYITRTGERYHRAGCRHLSRSSAPLSLSDAVMRGYTACRTCRPKRS